MRGRCFEAVLDEMNCWLEDPLWEADPAQLAAWEVNYREALEEARASADWEAQRNRAHLLGARLEEKLRSVVSQRDALKAELDGQLHGLRALKAYRSGP